MSLARFGWSSALARFVSWLTAFTSIGLTNQKIRGGEAMNPVERARKKCLEIAEDVEYDYTPQAMALALAELELAVRERTRNAIAEMLNAECAEGPSAVEEGKPIWFWESVDFVRQLDEQLEGK